MSVYGQAILLQKHFVLAHLRTGLSGDFLNLHLDLQPWGIWFAVTHGYEQGLDFTVLGPGLSPNGAQNGPAALCLHCCSSCNHPAHNLEQHMLQLDAGVTLHTEYPRKLHRYNVA